MTRQEIFNHFLLKEGFEDMYLLRYAMLLLKDKDMQPCYVDEVKTASVNDFDLQGKHAIRVCFGSVGSKFCDSYVELHYKVYDEERTLHKYGSILRAYVNNYRKQLLYVHDHKEMLMLAGDPYLFRDVLQYMKKGNNVHYLPGEDFLSWKERITKEIEDYFTQKN